MSDPGRVRLHITPFNEALYPTIINKSIQPLATALSYHTVQSDPDRGFGYVELPKLEADKLKKKLNGMTLKGTKMKIEIAKPEKRKRAHEEKHDAVTTREEAAEEKPKKKKAKKSKRKDGEIPGFELPDDRQVKRGWTEDPATAKSIKDSTKHNWREAKEKAKEGKDKKKDRKVKQEKSKFTTNKELLFKTHLPEKAVGIAAEDAKKAKQDKKEKKLKDKRGRKDVVIHEFEKNYTFPSFLRTEKTAEGKGVAAEFVEGKGWVDQDGNLVEEYVAKGKREDRLAQMPENALKVPDEDDSEDDADIKVAKKIKFSEPEKVFKTVATIEEPIDEPEQDEKTKERLARIDKMLDDEGPDSDENFNDAASEVESKPGYQDEDDDDDEEDEEEDEQFWDNDDTKVITPKVSKQDKPPPPAESESSDSEDEKDEEYWDDPKELAQKLGKEEDMALKEQVDEDEVMADQSNEESSDIEEEVDEMDKEPADRESAKTGKTMDVDATPKIEAESEESSEGESEESDESPEEESDSDLESSSDSEDDASDKEDVNQEPNESTPPPQEKKEVHPLEALYKRPKPSTTGTPNKPAPIQTSFSFFGGDDNSDIESENQPEETYMHPDRMHQSGGAPQTPYTDSRGRRSRSAAPTPDTAAIGKRFSFSLGRDSHPGNYNDIEEDYDEENGGYDQYDEYNQGYGYDDDMQAINEPAYNPNPTLATHTQFNDDGNASTGEKGEETGFAKWFWENRGDSNRAWKKRRREVLKVVRQRENRRVGRKVV
ncbi:hypothetical protein BDV97DRAFT_349681 [Delphinella strobiligena]|nr:hypothetical protein BDV97DRAFT_349681 [Delphinella strobiligena]